MIWPGAVLIRLNMVRHYMENSNNWGETRSGVVHAKHILYLSLTQKLESRQGDSPGHHCGRWSSLRWSSPVTIRTVILTTLLFQRAWIIYGMFARNILLKITCVILGPYYKNEMCISCQMMCAAQTHNTLLYPTHHLHVELDTQADISAYLKVVLHFSSRHSASWSYCKAVGFPMISISHPGNDCKFC